MIRCRVLAPLRQAEGYGLLADVGALEAVLDAPAHVLVEGLPPGRRGSELNSAGTLNVHVVTLNQVAAPRGALENGRSRRGRNQGPVGSGPDQPFVRVGMGRVRHTVTDGVPEPAKEGAESGPQESSAWQEPCRDVTPMTRSTIQRTIAGLTACFLAVAAIAFPVLVGFRCQEMETVHDRPCCQDVSLAGEARFAGNCCALEARGVGSGLAAEDARAPDLRAPIVPVSPRAPAFVAAPPGLLPIVRDTGPLPGLPLRLRDCSLLI